MRSRCWSRRIIIVLLVALLPTLRWTRDACAQVEQTLPVFLADYEGRQPFLVWPAEDPPLKGKPVGWAAELGRYDVAVAAVGPKPGMVIADIGCGKGSQALIMAPLVGPDTIVYCRDTNRRHLDVLTHEANEAGVENLDIRLSQRDDVLLEPASVDVVLLADIYHNVRLQKSTYDGFMTSVWDALKPEGLVIVTYQRSSHLFKPDEAQAVFDATMAEFIEAGYETGARWALYFDQKRPVHILEFRKPLEQPEPEPEPEPESEPESHPEPDPGATQTQRN